MPKRNTAAWILISAPAVWLILFFIVPVMLMGVMSVRPDMEGNMLSFGWAPTLDNYRTVFDSESYLSLLWLSVRLAALVALITTTLAYPLAYFLAFRAGRRRGLLLTLLLLPFWTSYLLRIIAWKIILDSNGLLNSALMSLGIIQQPSAG